MDKDVIDVRPKQKFLTGKPAWMESLFGRVALTIYGAVLLALWGYELVARLFG